MKKHFNTSREVCAVWAAQDREEAISNNLYMKGDRLFHYNTMIGRIDSKGRLGVPVALITITQYSNGTSKVQNEARAEAEKAGLTVFRVKRVVDEPSAVKDNLADYNARALYVIDKLAKGLVTSADSYRRACRQLIDEAEAYSRHFKGGWRWKGPQPEDVLHPKEQQS